MIQRVVPERTVGRFGLEARSGIREPRSRAPDPVWTIEKLRNYGASLDVHPVDVCRLRGVIERVTQFSRWNDRMEGAVVFGISLALYGAITLKDGAVQQSNFLDYKLARIGDVPKKTIFALTGTRVRALPLSRSLQV
jgi:hypothetical protein